jgi:hypothetical protein
MALPPNIRLSSKGLPGTSNPFCSLIGVEKSSTTSTPGRNGGAIATTSRRRQRRRRQRNRRRVSKRERLADCRSSISRTTRRPESSDTRHRRRTSRLGQDRRPDVSGLLKVERENNLTTRRQLVKRQLLPSLFLTLLPSPQWNSAY